MASLVVQHVAIKEIGGTASEGERLDATLRLDKDKIEVLHGDLDSALAVAGTNPDQLWKASPSLYMLRATGSSSSEPRIFSLRPLNAEASQGLAQLHSALTVQGDDAGMAAAADGGTAAGGTAVSHFDRKTDSGSADLYFHYYGMLQHQQNMLQDYIRTGTYHAAITENPADFQGKAVMDVGCGSGILSLFAAAAGARVVYAVEASSMAHYARQLAAANPGIGDRIKVLHGKVEEVEVPEKVDVLVSEPMGTLLVNERMIESYIYARDHHLKPGGKMFPRLGRIHVAAFSDPLLHSEVAAKAGFWAQSNFYGVDLTALQAPAGQGYFAQVVVDQIPSNVLVSNCATHVLDFSTCTEAELTSISIPLSLQMAAAGTVHGVASWFDVLFDGSQSQRWLSTAPGLPITHWFQLRCVLEQPLLAPQPGCTLSGSLRLEAHSRQSYDVFVSLKAPPVELGGVPQASGGKFDLKEPYYRQLTQWYSTAAAAVSGMGTTQDAATTAAVLPGIPQLQPVQLQEPEQCVVVEEEEEEEEGYDLSPQQ